LGPWVTVGRAPSMSDGLDTSTVTPGRTAPDGSFTIPAIALWANDVDAAPMTTNTSDKTLIVRVIAPSQRRHRSIGHVIARSRHVANQLTRYPMTDCALSPLTLPFSCSFSCSFPRGT